jgi:trk system potassium uptake protein TrkA
MAPATGANTLGTAKVRDRCEMGRRAFDVRQRTSATLRRTAAGRCGISHGPPPTCCYNRARATSARRLKIIILGAGQVGRTAAYHLSREEANDVTVVDSDDDVLRELQDRLDIRTISGNAANPAILEAAGCADADLVVALTNSDEVNMVACQVAWTLFKTPTKIARIRARAYLGRTELFSEGAGFAVDVSISPEQLVTEYVVQLIRYPGALQVLDFADGRVRLVGVRAVEGGLLVGQPIRNIRSHIPNVDSRVAAIYRRGRSVKPEGDTVIEPGDEVFFLAARENIRQVMSELRKLEKPVRRVVIAGGGNIGIRLAQALEDLAQVKLIERDPKRARRASEVLRNTIVLTGDAADEELLLEENIDSADAFVAVTNAEEANILSSMLAKRLGCQKVMALINKPSYAELMESGTLDVAISPQTITIGSLLAHVRRGDVVKVHSLRRGAAEAIEAIAHGDDKSSKVVGRQVDQIRVPEGTTIGAIVRSDEVVMAHHDTIIREGDHVILFLTDRRQVEAVEKLFQVGVSFI